MKPWLLIFVTVLLASCTGLKEREIVIFDDANPPTGYDPVFMTQVKDFDPDNINDAKLEISSIDTRRPDKVIIRAHLSDERMFYLKGAAEKPYRDFWCGIFLTVNGERKIVKLFDVNEVNAMDKEKYAIAFAMDHSGSMGDDRAFAVQRAMKSLIEAKRRQDAFSLIKYDAVVGVESPLTTSRESLSNSLAIDGLGKYGGMTAIANAVGSGLEQLIPVKDYDSRAVVVFTDGFDNSSTFKKDSVIAVAANNNIMVCGVDFGANIDTAYMKGFSRNTGGTYHHIYKTDEFKYVFDDIYTRLSNYYEIPLELEDYGRYELELIYCLNGDTLSAKSHFSNIPDVGTITLLRINFDFDKASIKRESLPIIKSVAKLMETYPAMMIEIQGHTDNRNSTGDTGYNQKLSQKRADAVQNALINLGIAKERIKTKGYGDLMPVASNDTDEGRRQNRRTEFVVIKK